MAPHSILLLQKRMAGIACLLFSIDTWDDLFHIDPNQFSFSAFLRSKTRIASSAAFTPLRAMAPNVGPELILGQFCHMRDLDRGLTHAVGTVDLRQFHTTDYQTRNNLAGTLDNRILSRLHV